MRLRGALSLFTVGILFLVADLIQRIIVAGMVRMHPGSRDAILERWMRALARFTLRVPVQFVGGARIAELPAIEGRAGSLILMNHQSLLDIPLAVLTIRDRHPLIVTRRRYARGIPLVSHMLRLYGMPLVEPGSRTREQIEELARVARAADHPLLIFPEGHRTRDGEIRPFKRAGLEAILAQRDWQTHVLVADGFWRCGRLADYVTHITGVRGRIHHLGPFDFVATRDDPAEFAERMHAEMRAGLAALRASEDA